MPKTQTIRLTAKQVAEHRDMQVRGEALGLAAQYCGSGPNRIDDVIRGADKIYASLKDRQVPEEPNLEIVASGAINLHGIGKGAAGNAGNAGNAR